MKKLVWSRSVASGVAVASLFFAFPAQADGVSPTGFSAGDASGSGAVASEKIRRLDIMLMVTGLRCRTTADDFQADYQAFEARHLADLNAAAHALAASYSGRLGAVEANRMLDRISVQIANQYGNGHPWLGCHELKGLAQSLAQEDGAAVLLQAANEITDGDANPAVAGASAEVSAPPAITAAPLIAYAPPAEANGNLRLAGR